MRAVSPVRSSSILAAPAKPAHSHDNRVGAHFAFAAICVIWGTTFAAIRVAIETIPTLLVVGVRFLVAGFLLLLVAKVRRARFPQSPREWRDQIIAGILMAGVANSLVVWAEHHLSSGLAALLAATIPIWMVAMEAILDRSSITPGKAAGLALGFGGVSLLVAPAIGRVDLSLEFLLAVGAMQLNVICWNGGTLLSRRHRDGADPVTAAVVQTFSGGTVAMVAAFASGEHFTLQMFSFRSTVALFYLAVFGSVIAYTAYNYALSKLSAGKVSSFAYVNPITAVLAGAVLLHEPVTWRMIGAMTIILTGVLLIQIERRNTAA